MAAALTDVRAELGEVDKEEVLKSGAWHRIVALKCEPCDSDNAELFRVMGIS